MLRWIVAVAAGVVAAAFCIGVRRLSFTPPPACLNESCLLVGVKTAAGVTGLPTAESFLVVFPFCGIGCCNVVARFFRTSSVPKNQLSRKTDKVLMNIDDTMTSCSVRQAVGSILGGANFTSSWGTYIGSAASIAKRPIPGGAVLTAVLCIIARLWGISDGLGDLAK